jgi:hypothetical protein
MLTGAGCWTPGCATIPNWSATFRSVKDLWCINYHITVLLRHARVAVIVHACATCWIAEARRGQLCPSHVRRYTHGSISSEMDHCQAQWGSLHNPKDTVIWAFTTEDLGRSCSERGCPECGCVTSVLSVNRIFNAVTIVTTVTPRLDWMGTGKLGKYWKR